ncbi:hypothetical protein [Phreatobacter sp.]|uniref:glycosyltransferase n=1 Tax=Phreatobacter sp. TaxID=1966341 RepID=UPI0022C71E95|nr:hypothetical protein [Phreatobacter sp.]MCZ8316881.1 hypothetical protein [Phreatobacter sp.]
MTALPNPIVDGSRLRILHLPVDLGGHPAALARAQRALGHDAVAANLAWSPFGFHGDINHAVEPGKPCRLVRRELGRVALLARAFRADVIHAHFGQTLFSLRPFPITDPSRHGLVERATVAAARALWMGDLALWRRMGKALAMTFYGDDVRLVSGAVERNPWSHLGLPEIARAYEERDPWKRLLGDKLGRAGVTLFAVNPDLLDTLPAGAEFLPYAHVDLGREALDALASTLRTERELRLLHLPSDRAVKGTEIIVSIVDRLRAEGVACRLTVVENLKRDEVPALFARHDALIDQLRVGWYGGVAVEAMAACRPALAHIAPRDLQHIPHQMAADLPVIAVTADTLAAKIRELAALDSAAFRSLGLRSRAFAQHWHAPEAAARRTIAAYRSQLG